MSREHVSFPGPQGTPLVGRLESPDGDAVAYALFAHCFTCSKDLRSSGVISRELLARGIGVLRFDFTGIGESGGDIEDASFSRDVDDLLAAADFLRRERRAPALLIGHSLGGTAMLAAAPRIPESVAVATIAAPSDTAHLRQKLIESVVGSDGKDHLELDLGGPRPVRLRRQFLDELALDEPDRHRLAHLDRALLILHSPVDRVVAIENAERLFLEARHPKSFLSLGGADHLLSDPRDAAHAGAVLAAWAGRYFPEVAERAAAAPQLAPGEVEVHGVPGSLRQEIHAGGHTLVADEPAADGGTDEGPTPYGFLLAALGACTSMTMRLYAQRKSLPLGETHVRLRHTRGHAKDCRDCAEASAHLERIEIDIELQGALTAEQRQRLLEIADRCPVHRTLADAVEIVTRLR
jgi:uncharacterized OsmC-like protein/alpha-beta hydrolase superfamily lysophospholipase